MRKRRSLARSATVAATQHMPHDHVTLTPARTDQDPIPTHWLPSANTSFFQTGTVSLIRSMA